MSINHPPYSNVTMQPLGRGRLLPWLPLPTLTACTVPCHQRQVPSHRHRVHYEACTVNLLSLGCGFSHNYLNHCAHPCQSKASQSNPSFGLMQTQETFINCSRAGLSSRHQGGLFTLTQVFQIDTGRQYFISSCFQQPWVKTALCLLIVKSPSLFNYLISLLAQCSVKVHTTSSIEEVPRNHCSICSDQYCQHNRPKTMCHNFAS